MNPGVLYAMGFGKTITLSNISLIEKKRMFEEAFECCFDEKVEAVINMWSVASMIEDNEIPNDNRINGIKQVFNDRNLTLEQMNEWVATILKANRANKELLIILHCLISLIMNEEKISLEDGKKLVQYARENIENYLQTGKKAPIPEDLKKKFADKAGAFVTLTKGSNHELRGCIGYIMPIYPLFETIEKVSLSAAFDDPRFPKVKLQEMNDIFVEVSVLTVPEVIEVSKPEDYLNEIEIGRDGLIITKGQNRGLLLPQVPVEHGRNWDVETFLEHTCQKAWLGRDAWKKIGKTKIERFTAIIFEENSPRGDIRRKEIGE